MSNKIKWIILIGVLFVLGFAGGVLYWSYLKAKTVSSSAMEAAKNAQTQTESLPSPTPSGALASNLTLPLGDVEGKDLSDVPRYPESMRSSFYQAEDSDSYTIDYIAKEDSIKIIDYYKKILTQNGWNLRAADKGAWNFEKVDAKVTVEVVEENILIPITQYRIQYMPVSSLNRELKSESIDS